MKLKEIVNEASCKKTKEEEENQLLTPEQIEELLDIAMEEFGDNQKVKKQVSKITSLLMKKDIVEANKQAEVLENIIRKYSEERE